MTAKELILSMGWDYENTEMSARFVAEHAVKTMYSDREVYKLLDTLWDSLDVWYNNPEHGEFSLRNWFNNCELNKNNKTSQEQINSVIDVLNTQGSISEGDEPVLIDNDCTCDKCGKESRGSHSCPFDEEFNSGYSDSCNCCDSCRRECLMDI